MAQAVCGRVVGEEEKVGIAWLGGERKGGRNVVALGGNLGAIL
jgi:hypothetical protein